MSQSKKIRSINPEDLSVRQRHLHLLASVAPRPIALASTTDKDGNINLSPFSFFNVFSANPPIMVFSPSRRGRDNTEKHTYQNLREVPEVSINVVTYDMVQQISLSSTEYEKGVNEFIKSGLTAVDSDEITPPRVAESPVSFECRVDQIIELGKEGGAGILILARVIKMHIDEAVIDDNGLIKTHELDLVGRMGGNWYSRTNQSALFEVQKPLSTKGIGVDQLPTHVRFSKILTGNDLGILGNLKALPGSAETRAIADEEEFSSIIKDKDVDAIHKKAKILIEENQPEKALTLLSVVE